MNDAAHHSSGNGAATWTIRLDDEAVTIHLASDLAVLLQAGDVVTLSGGLGAGKTTLASAMIRALTGDIDLDVPSPTFTLMQLYDGLSCPIVHADLYRLSGVDELEGLGFEDAINGAITLIEWPERAAKAMPVDRLDVALRLGSLDTPQVRLATLTGYGAFAGRLTRMRAVHKMLAGAGWLHARRDHLQGDASTRAYERLTNEGDRQAILMIAPRRPDGPPVRRGKPYSAIAKLAESVHAFVAMAEGLSAQGFSAPQIMARDLEGGLLLIEDFGTRIVVDAEGPIAERYEVAAQVLAKLHGLDLPSELPLGEDARHIIPPYDLEALLIEVELLLDWYLPHIGGGLLSAVARAEFVNLWSQALNEVVAAPQTWTLRDYHSPNLMWLPDRAGINRIGLLDFQDAVMGHPAYDMVSLAQDARVDVAPALEFQLLGRYGSDRRNADANFDMRAFAQAYAILGAQRATKILGIFARLDKRDGKPAYLRHLPRVENYVRRNLEHPALRNLRTWYQSHLPRLFDI
jgi:N-acetylmuramate 1-kinase